MKVSQLPTELYDLFGFHTANDSTNTVEAYLFQLLQFCYQAERDPAYVKAGNVNRIARTVGTNNTISFTATMPVVESFDYNDSNGQATLFTRATEFLSEAE